MKLVSLAGKMKYPFDCLNGSLVQIINGAQQKVKLIKKIILKLDALLCNKLKRNKQKKKIIQKESDKKRFSLL